MKKSYICIDLKTFYASVECVVRGLDPFKTNLVVADGTRGAGAICLAISPALKSHGVRNRCRLFEIPKNIKYITAMPRMKLYIDYAAKIYEIYLRYISKDDIFPYSIDEMFIDATNYLSLYNKTDIEFAKFLLAKIYEELHLPAAAGVGTNLFLCKIALDITAKHANDNIGYLDEEKFKKELWDHEPLMDFWQISTGIQNRLNQKGIYTMRDIANSSEEILYKEFGINAEILIDHAKGIESVTIKDIKAYKPKSNSLSHSQILFEDYSFNKARLVLKEMVELISLELIDKHLVSSWISLSIGYSNDSIKPIGKSLKLPITTNVFTKLLPYFLELFDEYVDHNGLIRRIGIGFQKLQDEDYEQLDLFTNLEEVKKERALERAINDVKHKYGKNSILKAMNLEEGATTIKRNKLIGGHNGGEDEKI